MLVDIKQFVPDIILNMKLKNMQCKHVFNLTKRARDVLTESKNIGYNFCQWGFHSGNINDFLYQMNKILSMEKDNYEHAIRVVICKYSFSDKEFFWVDNLHSTIMQIRKHGMDAKLADIPFYVIDITDYHNPIVMSHNHSVRNNYKDIFGAISCAYKRYERSNSDKLISLNYTVANFLEDNDRFYTYCNEKAILEKERV